MTVVNLMDDLAKFLSEVNSKYFLKDDKKEFVGLKVYPGSMPIRESRNEIKTPCIEIAVLEIKDGDSDLSSGESTAKVRIYFQTYSEDKKNGWREIYNFMEHNRLAFLRKRTILNKYRLNLPLTLSFPEPEAQAYPHYIGFMEAEFIIAQPKEEVNY